MVTFIDEWRRKFPSCMVVKRLTMIKRNELLEAVYFIEYVLWCSHVNNYSCFFRWQYTDLYKICARTSYDNRRFWLVELAISTIQNTRYIAICTRIRALGPPFSYKLRYLLLSLCNVVFSMFLPVGEVCRPWCSPLSIMDWWWWWWWWWWLSRAYPSLMAAAAVSSRPSPCSREVPLHPPPPLLYPGPVGLTPDPPLPNVESWSWATGVAAGPAAAAAAPPMASCCWCCTPGLEELSWPGRLYPEYPAHGSTLGTPPPACIDPGMVLAKNWAPGNPWVWAAPTPSPSSSWMANEGLCAMAVGEVVADITL